MPGRAIVAATLADARPAPGGAPGRLPPRGRSDQGRRGSGGPHGAGPNGNGANGNAAVGDGRKSGNGKSNGHAARAVPSPAPAGRLENVTRVLGRALDVDVLAGAFALLLGAATTLYVGGYSFGEKNQSVYLLGGYRAADPSFLAHDWLLSGTTFFHSTFGVLTHALVRFGALEVGCLVGYLALVFLAHLAWLKLVLRLGGTQVTYLVSLLLFYASARGIAPGACDLFQDGSFQPSTIASVAMLWGIYHWVGGGILASAACLGLAGLFHVNFAVMGCLLFSTLTAWRWLRGEVVGWRTKTHRGRRRADAPPIAPPAPGLARYALGLGIILLMSVPSIVPSALRPPSPAQPMPLSEYVDLFVKLRAPHHFDPLSWSAGTWLSFLWPIPLAALAVLRAPPTPARREASRVFGVTLGVCAVSFVGAGVWFVSEIWIQMFFYRFAIFPKLLTCIGAAYWAGKWTLPARRQPRLATLVVAAGACAMGLVVLNKMDLLPIDTLHKVTRGTRALIFLTGMVLICGCVSAVGDRRLKIPVYAVSLVTVVAQLLASSHWLAYDGWMSPREADYLAVCNWAKDPANTPTDAVFVVPPSEEAFRLRARRAIVVNFKGIPPFTEQLPEWRDRLEDVLDVDDLRALPRGMSPAIEAMRVRYESLPPAHLVDVAKRYGARYVLTARSQKVDPSAVVYQNNSFTVFDAERLALAGSTGAAAQQAGAR